jgi:hypothetical protein
VRITSTPPLAYGQAVLKAAARRRCGEPVALGAAGPYQELRCRFLALQQIRPASPRRWQVIGALLAAAGAALLVPWRVTAQVAPAKPAPLSTDQGLRPPKPGSASLRRQEVVPEKERRQSELKARLAAVTEARQLEARRSTVTKEREQSELESRLSAVTMTEQFLRAQIARRATALTALRAQEEAHRRQLAELAAQRHALLRQAEIQKQELAVERARLNQVRARQSFLLQQQKRLVFEREPRQRSRPPSRRSPKLKPPLPSP